MKRSNWILGALLTCAISVTAMAQVPVKFSEAEIQTATTLREAAIKENQAYAILESLTTEVGPRMSGSRGDLAAVAWAQAKFKQLGFDKVWTEPVQYPVWERGYEKAEIIAPFPQALHITALGHSVATPKQGIQAAVIGFDNLQQLKDAPADSIKGKIVYIGRKMQVSRDYGPVVAQRTEGPVQAAKKGAIAVVIRSVGTDTHRLPHTGVTHYSEGVTKIPAAALSNPDADLLERMLSRGKEVVISLKLDNRTKKTFTSYNVIGEVTGSTLPDEYVGIGGHLDSWDLGTGALDDGAGCAITMAAAHSIIKLGIRPKRSIRVILYANEESGLIGGEAYYQAHKHELNRIQALSEADAGQGPVIEFATESKPETQAVVQQMHQVLQALGIRMVEGQGYPGPDMNVLKKAGAPGFSLRLQADDYFNFHHTADDTFDKVELARIRQSAAAYAVFAWMAAQAPVKF